MGRRRRSRKNQGKQAIGGLRYGSALHDIIIMFGSLEAFRQSFTASSRLCGEEAGRSMEFKFAARPNQALEVHPQKVSWLQGIPPQMHVGKRLAATLAAVSPYGNSASES